MTIQHRFDAPTDEKLRARVALLDSASAHIKVSHEMTDREIRIAALARLRPGTSYDGKSDDFVEAHFDHEIYRLTSDVVRADRAALGRLNEVSAFPTLANDGKGVIELAQDRADAEQKAAGQEGPPVGPMTVSRKKS